MHTPTIRQSRSIRDRLSKRRQRTRRVELSRDGLNVDGVRIPAPSVSADVGIERFGNAAILSVRIIADEVKVRGPFKRGVTIRETWR